MRVLIADDHQIVRTGIRALLEAVHTPTERDLRNFDVLVRQAADLIERRRTEEAALEKEQQLRALAARLDRRVDVQNAKL